MKFLMVLMVTTCLFACSDAKADVKVYDWVNIEKLKDLDVNHGIMNFTFKGKASDNGDVDSIVMNGTINRQHLTLNTNQFIKVRTYRINRDLLETMIELYDDLIEE